MIRVCVFSLWCSVAFAQHFPLFPLPAQLFPFPGNPGGATVLPAIVQVKSCSGSSTPINCSTTGNMMAGNVAVVETFSLGGNCTTVSSTPSNTFQLWMQSTSASNRRAVFVARNVASATNTFVVTCAGASSFVSTIIYELSGVTAADVVGSASGTGGTPSIATITSVGTGTEEVIASIFDISNFVTWLAGSGYTIQGRVNQSGSTWLGASEDNNTKTGLSGVQTATFTGVGSDPWNGTIITLASTSTPDAADTYINFEGLSNTVKPTVAQLQASTYGVPGTWTIGGSSVFTGATASQGTTTPAAHQIGATSLTGSGSLGLAYSTGSATNDLKITFPTTYSNLSWIGQFKTSVPQNDTNLNGYTLTQINDTSGAGDYAAPQLQANGSSLVMAFECPSANGSGTISIATNTLYYLFVAASHGGGTDNLRIYDSSGTEITTAASGTVAPITCSAKAGTQTWDHITFGVNGAEPESAGHVISFDNVRISYNGTALTP